MWKLNNGLSKLWTCLNIQPLTRFPVFCVATTNSQVLFLFSSSHRNRISQMIDRLLKHHTLNYARFSHSNFSKKRNYATCIPHNFHTCFNVGKERYFKLQNNAHVEKKTPTSECEFKKNVNDTRSSIDKESSFRRYASNSTIEWTTQTTAVNYLFPFYTTDVCYCGTGITSLYSFTAWMEFMVFLGETQRSKLGQVNIEFNSQNVKL